MRDLLTFYIVCFGVYLVSVLHAYLVLRKRDEAMYPDQPLEVTPTINDAGKVEVRWRRLGYPKFQVLGYRFEGGAPKAAKDIPAETQTIVSSNEELGAFPDTRTKPGDTVHYAFYLEGYRRYRSPWTYQFYSDDVHEKVGYITRHFVFDDHPLDVKEKELDDLEREKKLAERERQLNKEATSYLERIRAELAQTVREVTSLKEMLALHDHFRRDVEEDQSLSADLKARILNELTNLRERDIEAFYKKMKPS